MLRNKPFTRFAKKVRVTDAALREAIGRTGRGLIDADLGGGVIKQRIAWPGAGKSGAFRTIILFQTKPLAFFVHGFAKSELDDNDADELAAAKVLAHDAAELGNAVESLIVGA